MDRIEKYSKQLQEVIEAHAQYRPSYGEVEIQTLFDRANHHYQLLTVGWNGNERIHNCVIHADIKDGKIWIQHDGTESGIANELVERGIAREDIVLAFHARYKREYTGFAVG